MEHFRRWSVSPTQAGLLGVRLHIRSRVCVPPSHDLQQQKRQRFVSTIEGQGQLLGATRPGAPGSPSRVDIAGFIVARLSVSSTSDARPTVVARLRIRTIPEASLLSSAARHCTHSPRRPRRPVAVHRTRLFVAVVDLRGRPCALLPSVLRGRVVACALSTSRSTPTRHRTHRPRRPVAPVTSLRTVGQEAGLLLFC